MKVVVNECSCSDAIAKTKNKLQDEINSIQEKLDAKTDEVISLKKENDDLKFKLANGMSPFYFILLLSLLLKYYPHFILHFLTT